MSVPFDRPIGGASQGAAVFVSRRSRKQAGNGMGKPRAGILVPVLSICLQEESHKEKTFAFFEKPIYFFGKIVYNATVAGT